MNDELEDVLIVGGGDIGLVTALAIRKLNPDMDVTVVDDFQQDAPPVGKSTFKSFHDILHGTLDIDERRFIAEVRPVWKTALYARSWCDRPAFHYPFDPNDKYPDPGSPDALERYYHHYTELYDSPDHLTKGEAIIEKGKSPWFFGSDGDLDRYSKVAYQLNLKRFAAFMQNLCRKRGVRLVDDAITTVETTGSHVDWVEGERRRYESDLYVDATGFHRVLRGEQDASFRDFGFPLDSAYHALIDLDLSEIVPATVVDTGDHGWFWQIDSYDNRDLGYVYSSEHVDDETALDEFMEHIPTVAPDSTGGDPAVSRDDVATYEFSSGYYDRAMIENCVAIGNSQGFIEPLQSTGLTGNATAAVKLANMLSLRGRIVDDEFRDQYNTFVRRVWESIYDFIAVHYRYAVGDTPFWHDVATREYSPRVDAIIEQFDRNGLTSDIVPLSDDTGLLELSIFFLPDFYTIMRNLGAESVFYETNDFEVSDEVARELDDYYEDIDHEVEEYLTTEELYKGVMNF